jgi:putative FmdB family regulatory protein
MPTYEYECKSCGHRFEKFQSIKAAAIKTCPQCGKNAAQRLISAGAGIIFKGSGFYITDYRDSSYKEKAKAESGDTKSGDSKSADSSAAPATGGDSKSKTEGAPKADAKPASKAEGKPAPKAEAKPAPKSKKS